MTPPVVPTAVAVEMAGVAIGGDGSGEPIPGDVGAVGELGILGTVPLPSDVVLEGKVVSGVSNSRLANDRIPKVVGVDGAVGVSAGGDNVGVSTEMTDETGEVDTGEVVVVIGDGSRLAKARISNAAGADGVDGVSVEIGRADVSIEAIDVTGEVGGSAVLRGADVVGPVTGGSGTAAGGKGPVVVGASARSLGPVTTVTRS